MNDLDRNAALHQRINDAVATGEAPVVPPDEVPGATTLTQRFVANRRAGRPLLDGLTVFRGAKDPDVDAGTFHAGFKHASPMADLARGYAALANQKIGLVVPAAQGIGVLAEYALPPDARFVGNFGLEDDDRAARALTANGVDERLTPLIDAYLTAQQGPSLDRAMTDLHNFYRAYLYELAVPAGQPPLRRWVVQLDESSGVDRLLEHPAVGSALDAVLVDVVRERKLAVDAHGPARTASELRRGGSTGLDRLDAFAPGVSAHLTQTADGLDAVLARLRTDAYAVPLQGLSDALAWRRRAQAGLPLNRLTNSGMDLVFEHDHPGLRIAPQAQAALDAVESASYQAGQRPHRQAVLQQLRRTQTLAREHVERQAAFDAAVTASERAEQALAQSRAARDQGAERLEQVEQQHRVRRSTGVVARWLYRWGEEKAVLADLAQRRRGLDAQDRLVERKSGQALEQNRRRDALKAERAEVAEHLAVAEQRLRQQRKDGELEFLPAPLVRKLDQPARLSHNDWDELGRAAHRAVRTTDQRIAQGRRAAERLAVLATEVSAWRPDAAASPAPTVDEPGVRDTVIPLSRARLGQRLDDRANPASEASVLPATAPSRVVRSAPG